MAKVARLTNGTYNWVFRSENGQVKMSVTDRYKVTEKEEFTLEKGRTVYKTLKQCVPNIKVGFTPLKRELKSFRLITEEQVQAYDNHRRETLGEELWAEDSTTWPEFYASGYLDVHYSTGNLRKELSWLP